MYAFIDRPASGAGRGGRVLDGSHGTRLPRPSGAHGEFATLVAEGADACAGMQRIMSGPGGAHPEEFGAVAAFWSALSQTAGGTGSVSSCSHRVSPPPTITTATQTPTPQRHTTRPRYP